MSIAFNHTLVHAKEKWGAARDVSGVLGLAEPSSYGPFAVLEFDNGATLDFVEDAGDIQAQHYAFLVGEDDFDSIGIDFDSRDGSGGPTRTGSDPGRSITKTEVVVSTGRVRMATGSRSSPARTAARADGERRRRDRDDSCCWVRPPGALVRFDFAVLE